MAPRDLRPEPSEGFVLTYLPVENPLNLLCL